MLHRRAGVARPPVGTAQRCCKVPGQLCSRRRAETALNAFASSVAETVLCGGAALAGSIALDAAADKLQRRIEAVTNRTTPEGVRLYIAYPDSTDTKQAGTRLPAIIIIHQIFGVQRREVDLCDELARQGFIAVAPDTFGGQCTSWVPRALAVAFPRAFKAGATWGVPDVHSATKWLKQQPGVDASRVAVAGFCYGGGSAIRYAAQHPGEAAAVGVFYGRPADSSALKNVNVPVIGLYGTNDTQFPKDTIDAFERALQQQGAGSEIIRFEGEGHAFITDLAATKMDGSAAQRAWGAFLGFMRRHLQQRTVL